MKQMSSIITAALMLFMMSCNNQPKPAEEKPAAAAPAKPAETKPAFTPYKARMVELTVKDFDKWYTGFKSHDSMFKAYGFTDPGVGRELDNDKKVIVFVTIADLQKAKDFDVAPERKEAMKKGGVTKASEATYWNVIRDDTSTIPQKERVMVTHHVKDFDAWLKVYDGEGMAARAANGMVDRAMARGIDDPNTVTLLFAITDMAKAKARIASPELKKIMTDAGVDGPPQITYFKWVNM